MAKFRHNHIVPRSYLDLFAHDGSVACHFKRSGQRRNLPPSEVGVRADFYVVRGADGSRDTSWEQAMGPSENRAVQVLRDIENRWPLDSRDKATVAEFIALQLMRGPGWRRELIRLSDAMLPNIREDHELADELWEAATDYVLSRAFQRDTFMRFVSRGTAVFGSMHWSLPHVRRARRHDQRPTRGTGALACRPGSEPGGDANHRACEHR